MIERRTLVARAKDGDGVAFARLVEGYRGWAIACATALLGDYHLAQDVVQDAFAAAHTSLPTLNDPDAFPAWLKSIVRHRCYRVLRQHRRVAVPLDEAAELPSTQPEPERIAEEEERRHEVLTALATLPSDQRDLVVLHYWREYSHHEIAALVGLSVTTINNRLHAARQRLREEIIAMSDATSRAASINPTPPVPTGTIVAVHGPVVDVQFAHNRLPPLRSWLVVSSGSNRRKPLLAVVQYVMDGIARAVAVSTGTTPKLGLSVVEAGENVAAPVDDQNAREAVAQIARIAHQSPSTGTRIETGIKALDLFCPLVDGDVVGFAARPGIGQIVLIQELLYRVATRPGQLTLLAAVPTLQRSACSEEDPYGIGGVQTVYLPLRDMTAPPPGFLDPVDARLTLSLGLARLGMYPAIDPNTSTSTHLDALMVGTGHVEIASRVRDLLRRFPPDQESADLSEGLAADDRVLAARARRLRRFLTQPLYVAGPWIRWSAAFVPIAETLRGCRAILDGAHDALPEETFYMANSIDQVIERAKTGSSGPLLG